jgi:hypothetical protein
MFAIKQVNIEPMTELLRRSAQDKSKELDELMERLRPNLQFDSEELRILFCACSSSNTITVGVPCTQRLQAHAYGYAIILLALETPGLSPNERKKLRSHAYPILNWALSRDLHQWLAQIEGTERPLEDIFAGAGVNLPNALLSSLTVDQLVMGEGLFRHALAFILLHELAHLHYRHKRDDDNFWREQEKAADQFAAEWLTDLSQKPIDRMANLFGIAIALLWTTVFDIFFWPRQSETHPPGYDRLYQVLDQVVDINNDNEKLLIWDFVSRILFAHCRAAKIQVEPEPTHGLPRDRVNYLIDLISKKSPPVAHLLQSKRLGRKR